MRDASRKRRHIKPLPAGEDEAGTMVLKTPCSSVENSDENKTVIFEKIKCAKFVENETH